MGWAARKGLVLLLPWQVHFGYR